MLSKYDINTLKKDWFFNCVFFLFITIIIVNRIWLFYTINLNYIDNDQPIMWLGAKHYSEGLFYEPRFYGQDYNTLMEAFFAVPLIKLGFPVYYAVPIATHFIFLVPFLFTAFYLFINKKKEQAIIVLCVLLCMPTGYDIINSIPRGFVTGLFFTSLFIISLVKPTKLLFITINTTLAYVGYLVNQNSVLVSGPFLAYLFFVNYSNKKYYIYSLIGVLIALPVDYLLNHFYKVHPNYVFYPANNFFSVQFFKDAVSHLDQRFAHISFFIEEKSVLVIILFFAITLLLYKKNIKLFFSFLIFFAVIIVSFFSSKVSDGIVWPFYSYSRMYLGIPIIVYLFIVVLPVNFKKSILLVIFITICFTVYKEFNFKNKIVYHTQEKMWGHVNLTSLKDIKVTLETYKRFCKENNVEHFIMINAVWRDDIINYAGPSIHNDFPNTFKPSFERRTWIIEKEKKAIHDKFIIYTANYDFDKLAKEKYKFIDITRLDDYGLFLIKNNKLTTVAFLKTINATTEGF